MGVHSGSSFPDINLKHPSTDNNHLEQLELVFFNLRLLKQVSHNTYTGSHKTIRLRRNDIIFLVHFYSFWQSLFMHTEDQQFNSFSSSKCRMNLF